MSEQRTFASVAWQHKGKVTRRERFLAEMDQVIPWRRLLAVIAPHYPKAGRGRQPLGLEKMLRIYFVQQWFNLSDPAAEDALYDSESIRRFVGVELGDDVVPDESSILRFRHLLEEHQLTAAVFAEIRDLLIAKRLLVQTGTIVDATIIAAPSSTKNAEGERDPEMRRNVRRFFWRPRAILATIAEWDIKVRPRPGAWLQLRTDDGNAASRHETSPYFADARPCGPRARRRTPSRRRCR